MYQILRLCPIVALGLFLAMLLGTSADTLDTIGTGLGRFVLEGIPAITAKDVQLLMKGDVSAVVVHLSGVAKMALTNITLLVKQTLACILKFLKDVLQGFPKGVNAAINDLLNCGNDAVIMFFAPPHWPKFRPIITLFGSSTTGSKTTKKGREKFPTPLANIFPTRPQPPVTLPPQDPPPPVKMPPRDPPRPVDHRPRRPRSPRSRAVPGSNSNYFANSNSNNNYFPNDANSFANSDSDSFKNANANSFANGNRGRGAFSGANAAASAVAES